MVRLVKALFLSFCLIAIVHSAPAPTKKTASPPLEEGGAANQNTGLYYDEYLRTVVKLLESNEDFRKTMENADFEDIKSGKLSEELYKIPTDIRQKLDYVKKEEISRLRRILRAKMDLDKGRRVSNPASLRQIANHLDSSNPHSFEAQDLTNLIKSATKDLENFDEKRHEEFKRYEMTKELKRQEKFKLMSDEEKRKAEMEFKEMRQKHEKHEDVNHPGSKAQFNEVWKEKDGLSDENFDPKTFFIMHDLNADGTLDPVELEALFEKELAKVYDPQNPEDDMIEMEEERRRMREHVMTEVDLDSNGLISMDEFLKYSKTPEFENPKEDSYKSIDDLINEEEIYSREDLEEFREIIAEQEADLRTKLGDLRKQAQTVSELKSDVEEHEKQMGEDPPENEKKRLEEKKEVVKEEEKILQEMHEDIRDQSQEIEGMKEELKQQERDIEKLEQEPVARFDENDEGAQEIPNELAPGEQENLVADQHAKPLQMERALQ